MILTEEKLRIIIRAALIESLSKFRPSKAAKGLGAEYLYALLQPTLIDTGNLDLTKIELPVHQQAQREEEDISFEDELKNKGADIRSKDNDIEYNIHSVDIPKLNLNPEDDLKIK